MLLKHHDWIRQARQTLYVAIDIETSGLAHAVKGDDGANLTGDLIGARTYPILEVAVKYLDGNLDEIGPPRRLVINHDYQYLMDNSSDFSIGEFKDSLFKECHESNVALSDASKLIAGDIAELTEQHNIPKENRNILGNSVDLDRSFILHQMPEVNALVHYRLADVTALKVFFGRLFGSAADFKKASTHRADLDIDESIAELKFYIDNFIKPREVVAREQLREF